jgi:hypothetical protein
MPNTVSPNGNSNIPLGEILKALADDPQVGQTSNYDPADGRVLKDSVSGTIYVGDGSSWIDVDATCGIELPQTSSDRSISYSDLRRVA